MRFSAESGERPSLEGASSNVSIRRREHRVPPSWQPQRGCRESVEVALEKVWNCSLIYGPYEGRKTKFFCKKGTRNVRGKLRE